MMSKTLKSWLVALLAALLAFSCLTFVRTGKASALDTYSVDPATPFYNNPGGAANSDVKQNADGDFVITQKTGGGGVRLFGGDYTPSVSEHSYDLDLTDLNIRMSVDQLKSGQTLTLGLITYVQNGGYPQSGYGQGLSLNFQEDGKNGFNMSLRAFATSGYAEIIKTGNLVYQNEEVRPSFAGKVLNVHFFVEGETLKLEVIYEDDGSNPNKYNFGTEIELAALPTEGAQAFNYKKAQFVMTNDNGENNDTQITIKSISDPATDAYYASIGGKSRNSAKVNDDFDRAIEGFSKTEPTAAQVKAFSSAKTNFGEVDVSKLRKNDKFKYDQLAEIDVTEIGTAAVGIADKVFEGYTVDSDVTDKDDAIAVLAFYNLYADELTAYADIAANIEAKLSQTDIGQGEVIKAIDALIAKYPSVSRVQYLDAQKDYNTVLDSYNALSAAAKKLVTNYTTLTEFESGVLSAGKAAYYSTTGSYFSNNWISGNGNVGAFRNDDGSTSIVLPDNTSSRLVYGSDIVDDAYSNYYANLNDYSFTYTLSDITGTGRFSFNFAEERGVLPWGGETVKGIALYFRMNGANSIDVVLANVAKGDYPTAEQVSGIDATGKIGSLSHSGGIIGHAITFSFKKNGNDIDFKCSIAGGNEVAATISGEKYLNEKLEEIDLTKLTLTVTPTEGLQSFNGGKDIVFTVNTIVDDYSRMVAKHKVDFATFKGLVTTLSDKTTLTVSEIDNYNRAAAALAEVEAKLRTYEAADYAALKNTLDAASMTKIDQMAAAAISSQVGALDEVTLDNFAAVKTALENIAGDWAKLTDAQKALYADYAADVAAISAQITDSEAAKPVFDDIAEIVVKSPLPGTIDALRGEYAEILSAYNALSAEQKALVSNHDAFVAYGASLDAYDPAASVVSAIEKLFTDYATITNQNKARAKADADLVTASYAELTDGQKAEVTNYAKLAAFYQKIDDFNQQQIDYAVAAEFDEAAASALALYETVGSDNLAAAEAAVVSLKEAYDALTTAQKALAENHGTIAELEAKIAACKAELADQAAADAVVAKIGAIGTVALTDDCKAKIDAARTAYDGLTQAQKAKVTNYKTLTDAESAYQTLKDDSEKKEEDKGGCGKKTASAMLPVLAVLLIAVPFRKKF